MATKYNHAFDFAFEVVSEHENPDDVSASELRRALVARAISLDDDEMLEACGHFDTYDIENNTN